MSGNLTVEWAEVETGVWCNGCMTSDAIRFNVLLLGADGVENFGQIEVCATCDDQP